jgi:hypothetical protein
MTNGLALLLGALGVLVPCTLSFLFLVWNAPELCDELHVDFREDSELRLDVRRDEAERMLARMNSELP